MSYRYKMLAAVVFMTAALLFLGACASAAPTPSPVSITQPATSTPRTPPPTWTATFTATPPPPTSTPASTATPSITPTVSAEDMCADFWVSSNLNPINERPRIFNGDYVITVLVDSVEPDSTIEFFATHRLTGENRGLEMSGGQTTGLQLPVSNLPQPGLYDWTLGINSPIYGEICQQQGIFIATSRESNRAAETTER